MDQNPGDPGIILVGGKMMSAERLVTRSRSIHVVEVQALSRRILQVALVLMLGIAVVQLVKLAPVPQVPSSPMVAK